MKDDSSMGDNQGGEMFSDSGYILEVEPTGHNDGLDT